MTPFLKKLSGAMRGLAGDANIVLRRWWRRYPKAFSYLPQSVAACVACLAGCCIVWLLPLQAAKTDLANLRRQETSLKQAYLRRLADAPRTAAMQTRKHLADQKLALLRQQLTGNTEQEVVMHEIDSAGRARGLRFVMFKPEIKQKTTIQLSAIGSYEAIARFVDDIAQLPRIVILDPLTLHASGNGNDDGNQDRHGNANPFIRLLNLQATATAIQPEPQPDNSDDSHETQD